MGQAKLRGTYEERKNAAIERVHQEKLRRAEIVKGLPVEQRRRAAHLLGVLMFVKSMGIEL